MPLSSEEQALFDHARNAVPRWLTRGKTTVLEWLHGFTKIFDAVRSQGQDWLDSTYLDNATGVELDQHGADRGTMRRLGESDDSYRTRLKNIADTITEPVLKLQIDNMLSDASLGSSAWLILRRDKAFFHRGEQMTYPLSVGTLQTYLGSYLGTNWTAGWSCDEGSGSLSSDFGSPSLAPVSTPTYANAAILAGDFAVGFNSSLDAFSGGDVHDVTATNDLVFVSVLQTTSLTGNNDIWGKGAGAVGAPGTAGYALVRETNKFAFYVGDGTNTYRAEVSGIFSNKWYVVICVLDRTRGKIRVGAMPIDTRIAYVGAATTLGSLGNMSNSSNFVIGDRGGYGAGNLQIAFMAVGVGDSYAGDGFATKYLVDNLDNAMRGVWFNTLKITHFLSRGYRMAYPQSPASYIVILPFGTSATLANTIREYLRTNGPAGYNYYVEVRGVP